MNHAIHILGSGDGKPQAGRKPTAILVTGGNGALLIDAGDGVARTLAEPEFAGLEIRTILLTHNHADHVAGLPFLFQAFKAQKRKTPLQILAPGGLGAALVSWLGALRMAPEKLPFQLTVSRLGAGIIATDAGHHLDIWKTDHLGDADGTDDECFGVTIEVGESSWIFSSDLASLEPLRGRLKGIEGLIVETAHVEPVEAVKLAKASGVKQVILTHVPSERSTEPVEGALWAEDGMQIQISGSSQGDK